MYPILFSIQGFELYALGLCYILGFGLFNIIVVRLSSTRKMNIGLWNQSIVLITIATVVASRAAYVLMHLSDFAGQELNVILPDGFSYYGGMLGCLAALVYLTRKRKESLLQWLDLFTVGFFGWLAVVSLGHFLDGSNYGAPTTLPWGVVYDNIYSSVVYTIPVHPIQVYQALFALLMLAGSWIWYKKTNTAGSVALSGGFALGVFDFAVQFLSGDDTLMLGVLRADQALALALWISCATLLLRRFLAQIER